MCPQVNGELPLETASSQLAAEGLEEHRLQSGAALAEPQDLADARDRPSQHTARAGWPLVAHQSDSSPAPDLTPPAQGSGEADGPVSVIC